MHLHVHDWTGRVGQITSFESFTWTRRAQDFGEFILTVNYTDALAALLQPGRVIEKSDDDDAAIIEDVRLVDGEEQKIHCSGRSVLSLLERRVVIVNPGYAPPTMTGTNAEIIGIMLQRHAIAPYDPERVLPVSYDPLPGLPSEVLQRSVSWRRLGTACIKKARAGGFGIRSLFNDGHMTVQAYPIEKILPVFSKSRGTVDSQERFLSMREFATHMIVGGEGDYPNRTVVQVGGSETGLDRFEKFLDTSSEVRSEDFGGDQTDYEDALAQAGFDGLLEATAYDEFTATTTAEKLVYKQDFDVGNVATVQTEFGFDADLLISEISEVYEDGIMRLGITFAQMITEEDEEDAANDSIPI